MPLVNIVPRYNPKARKVVLNDLDDASALELSESLKTNTIVEELTLFRYTIGDNGAKALCEVLQNHTTLKLFSFHGLPGDAWTKYFSKALSVNQTLNAVGLFSSNITDAGAQDLSNALKKNTHLKTLRLNFNSISDSGVAYLSEALRINTTLTYLDLGYNPFGNQSLEYLGEALNLILPLTRYSLLTVLAAILYPCRDTKFY